MATALGIDDLPGTAMIGSMAAFALVAGPPVGVNDFDPLSVALRETHRIEVPISPFQASGIRHQASAGARGRRDLTVRLLRDFGAGLQPNRGIRAACFGPRCRRRHRCGLIIRSERSVTRTPAKISNPPRTIPDCSRSSRNTIPAITAIGGTR